MKGVILTMKEKNIYECIKTLVDKGGNKNRVALKLGVTRRSVDRYIKKYKDYGKVAFRHKSHDSKPAHTIDETIKQTIIELFKN